MRFHIESELFDEVETYTNVTLVRCVDGDTAEFIVRKEFQVLDVTVQGQAQVIFRLHGINAPEKTGATKEAGLASKAFLEQTLAGKSFILRVLGKDKYGRYLLEIFADGVNVNDLMLEKGFAKPYMV